VSLTGTLGINICQINGKCTDVQFEAARPVPVDHLVAGMLPSDASKRISLLFSICGNAHAVAMEMACEAAEGKDAPEGVRQERAILVAAEALREHASRVLLDWPQLCDAKPAVGDFRAISDAFLALQSACGQSAAVFRAASAFGCVVHKTLLQPNATDDTSGSAKLIARIQFEQSETPESDPADNTVYGRHVTDARIAGKGVERRVEARLLEIETLCDWLECPTTSSPLALNASSRASGEAHATLDVARGQLIHEVTMQDGLIARYRIAAPTSANFSPGGAADIAIRNIRAKDRHSFEWLARLAILEVDPCVAYEVRIN
jgi:coenzyme F420-reducing hydrogenase alpha subunit